MKYNLNEMSLKEKIGQMIGLAFSGQTYTANLQTEIEDIGVGLVVYFKDNCLSPKQIFELNKKINAHAKIPPFIALDQEGGMVARVTTGITQSPGAMAIKAGSTKEDCYQIAYNMGTELRNLGFNFNFAPEGDVNNNPLNPVINVRSYSEDPNVVAEYMNEAVRGYTDSLLMTSVKHFPGHGDTAVDSHIGLPVVDFSDERCEKVELVPFKKVIENNLPGIMASHVMYTSYDKVYPTTLSKNIIQGLLRDKMGFKGLVVTDSLTMGAVWNKFKLEEIVLNGFNSGCDILLLCGARDINAYKKFASVALSLAESGKIPLDVIDRSVERILKYKEMFKVGQMLPSFEEVLPTLEKPSSVKFAQDAMNRAITMVKNSGKILPLKKEDKVLVVFPVIKVVTLVENADNTLNSLGDFLPFNVDKHYISIDPVEEDKALLISKTLNYDKIIYCSYNACFNPTQADLINSIDKDKLAVIAIRTPYDLNVLDVNTYLCSYEASVQAFIALSKVLTGEIEATGKLPVTLNIK